MIILIHTSKTMRRLEPEHAATQQPELIKYAKQLELQLKKLSVPQISKMMHVSPKLAATTHQLISDWSDKASDQRTAVDSFVGDIYSGLQVPGWTDEDRKYANEKLRILSGLYGILRPLDGIYPYRFEMGYRLPTKSYANLYTFWGETIYRTLPPNETIINLSAVEYCKTIIPYAKKEHVVTPRFLTISPKTNEPTFVVVHAKIARGAFANWLIKQRITDSSKFAAFSDLGYKYEPALSSEQEPVFVCQTFGGLGLSLRLT